MQRIFLIGYMGAGKTTLGRLLAQRMHLDFIDLDHFIEARYRKKITDLFTEKGEEGFRRLEQIVLTEVSSFENVIVSTGGGTPCFANNMQVMLQSGIVIYLKASAKSLFSRLVIAKSQRPLLSKLTDTALLDFIAENLAIRNPYYSQAHLTFNAEKLDNSQQVYAAVDLLQQTLSRTDLSIILSEEA